MMVVTIAISTLLLAVLGILITACKKRIHYWIIEDLKRSLLLRLGRKPKENIHIMFSFVDHFEPGHGGADLARQTRRVNTWIDRYHAMAVKHRDSDGCHPKHSFFYPPHYDTHDHLRKIVDLCAKGFGEVEMHLHHDHHPPWPDDVSSLRMKILACIGSYSRYGIFCLPDGQKRYGFIHGDWALANSRKNGKHCGVNDELTVLAETGCYADFTFPICNEAQPRLANHIFRAQSSPFFPKGYDKTASVAESGKRNGKGIMIIQGIIGLRWKSRVHRIKPSIEQSNIGRDNFPCPGRIDYWIKKGIHVKGKPNWIFVKVHAHGGPETSWRAVLGKPCDEMFTYLETKYNDGKKYSLHYVSAREMYNIIRAAEDGKDGNPNNYRDYEIPPYTYLSHGHRPSHAGQAPEPGRPEMRDRGF